MPLTPNDALVYAMGLNQLNQAIDILEDEIDSDITPGNYDHIQHQIEVVQKAISQWEDGFKNMIEDMIRQN